MGRMPARNALVKALASSTLWKRSPRARIIAVPFTISSPLKGWIGFGPGGSSSKVSPSSGVNPSGLVVDSGSGVGGGGGGVCGWGWVWASSIVSIVSLSDYG